MGVGAPGHSESSWALISIRGCQTSAGTTTGTPCFLVATAVHQSRRYFWIGGRAQLASEANEEYSTKLFAPTELPSNPPTQYMSPDRLTHVVPTLTG